MAALEVRPAGVFSYHLWLLRHHWPMTETPRAAPTILEQRIGGHDSNLVKTSTQPLVVLTSMTTHVPQEGVGAETAQASNDCRLLEM